MALNIKEILKRVNPPSAKINSQDDQWLEPASHDKKFVKAMSGDPEMYDQDEHEAENFKVQDRIKKNTKAPLKEADTGPVESSTNSVNELYEEESLELLEEIMDLIEEIDEDSGSMYCWVSISENLRIIRDSLVRSLKEEVEYIEYIEESFKVGNLKLKDKTSIKLSKEDVRALNDAVAGTDNKEKLIGDITKSKSHFNDFLEFAHNLSEDFEKGIHDLLSEASIEELEYIIENNLDESRSWETIKTTAKAGALGGAVVGGVVGGVYGAGAGVGIAALDKARRIQIERAKKKREKEIENHYKSFQGLVKEGDKSILGTASPALDSDEDEEDLQEISNKSLASYIDAAIHDQMAVSATGRTDPKHGINAKHFKNQNDVVKHLMKRQRGIDKAEDAIERKIATNKLYGKLGLNKLIKEEEDLQEISKDLAGKYIEKSSDDKANLKAIQAVTNLAYPNRTKDDPIESKNRRMISNRDAGIKRAIKILKGKDLNESGGLGGHPANYRNPAEKPIKFNKTETPVKPNTTHIITNNRANIDGPLASKVGDIVDVKFSSVWFLRMRVIEMLPNNQIKVQAFAR